ncbi:hypothetical protein ABFS82_09G106300 [Erythranthe guttata]|nr:PREDICTED: uncharacterized protein LOC105975571 [Erythranthe guttata]|eukprot:XP_012856226.1 PREDICTED: uncharacterized protein LOC105975571 [Erythranthe guttata]
MEQNLPIIAKKFWSIVRVLYFMLRKGISKGKLFSDLNSMIKRGKIAGKSALNNLILHHASAVARRSQNTPDPRLDEYEFSCSNTPAHPTTTTFRLGPFHLLLNKRKHSAAAAAPPPPPPIDAEMVAAALQIFHSASSSPALPGFGPSPMVRQLRITDSPFPIELENSNPHVDEAAEEFIIRFYNDLKKQNSMGYLGYNNS